MQIPQYVEKNIFTFVIQRRGTFVNHSSVNLELMFMFKIIQSDVPPGSGATSEGGSSRSSPRCSSLGLAGGRCSSTALLVLAGEMDAAVVFFSPLFVVAG